MTPKNFDSDTPFLHFYPFSWELQRALCLRSHLEDCSKKNSNLEQLSLSCGKIAIHLEWIWFGGPKNVSFHCFRFTSLLTHLQNAKFSSLKAFRADLPLIQLNQRHFSGKNTQNQCICHGDFELFHILQIGFNPIDRTHLIKLTSHMKGEKL